MTILSSRNGAFAASLLSLALVGVGGVTITGCGGGSAGTSATTTATLDSADTRATSTSTTDTQSVLATVSTTAYLADDEAGKAAVTRAATGYPTITISRTSTVSTVVVDFGTTPVTITGKRQISGVFTITRDRSTGTGSVTLANVTVNGHTVSGTISLSHIVATTTSVSHDTTFDLTIDGVGTAVGTQSVTVSRSTDLITVTSGSIVYTPTSGTPYTVAYTNLVMDPRTNGNMVPESGTLTIQYTKTVKSVPVTTTAVVTYTAQSPVTGVVQVSINGAAAVNYTLPGF